MRFLCLHGMGTSAAIFRTQTAAFRKLLDQSKHTFDFIDAPHESEPAHGVQAFFPPPNYTFWPNVDPGDLAATHRWLRQIFAKNRDTPYDALLCFSQGSAAVASFILAHNDERPEEPLPFKGAIFVCGGMPFAMLDELYLPVTDRARMLNEATGRLLVTKASSALFEIQSLLKAGRTREASRRGLWDRTDDLYHDIPPPGTTQNHHLPDLPLTDVYGLDMTRYPQSLQIDIPTVHVYGVKDPRYPAAIQLACMSDPKNRLVYDHGGGHEIPRTSCVSAELAEAVEWLDEQIKRTTY